MGERFNWAQTPRPLVEMIRYTVLGGYLGAGKTTLLNYILKHNDGIRFALLINDFGDINIDSALIESEDEQQINLANGCVCCNLSDGFFAALETLRTTVPPPQHIIVEASGVANVHNLGQYGLTRDLELAGIVVLADAETIQAKADDKYVAQTIRRQLIAADLIVLNKTDLVDEDKVADLASWIGTFNTCPVIATTKSKVPLPILLDMTANDHKELSDPSHAHYASWKYESEAACTDQDIHRFIDSLGEEVIRCKGLLKTETGSTEVQVVGTRHETTRRAIEIERSQLIAIGLAHDFSAARLDALAQQHLARAQNL